MDQVRMERESRLARPLGPTDTSHCPWLQMRSSLQTALAGVVGAELPFWFPTLHPLVHTTNPINPATLTLVCLLARFLCAPDTEVPGPEGSHQLPGADLLAYCPHHCCLLDVILDEL